MDAMKYMVCEGTPFKGFTFHGPFATNIQAESWAMARNNDGFWWIHEIEMPVLPNDGVRVLSREYVTIASVCDANSLDYSTVMRLIAESSVSFGTNDDTMITLHTLEGIIGRSCLGHAMGVPDDMMISLGS